MSIGEGIAHSEGSSLLDNAFNNSANLLVRNLIIKGGDGAIPSRKRPDIDFVTIVFAGKGKDTKAIDIYASGWWGTTTENGDPVAIGRVANTDPGTILELYVMMTDQGLVESVLRSISVPVDELVDKDRPKKTQEAVMVEQVQPIIDRYVQRNRQRLMTAFMRDMGSALQKVLGKFQS